MPSFDESITRCTPEDTALNACLPASHRSTMKANTSWIANAPNTVRGRMARRSVDNAKAISKSTTMPAAPQSTCT
ncbi:hypothetical protein GCM10027271_00470 [Saccharopolyspora gloriosae]